MKYNIKGISSKPPLGIPPFFIIIQCRVTEIRNAMLRYEEAEKPIPDKWKDELAILDKFINEGNETADKFPFDELK